MTGFPPSSVLLITGIMAAGKSTVAQAVAERLPRSVHLRGDLFRRMIVNDRAEMDTSVSDRMMEQLLLRYRLAAGASETYSRAGFTVVYQDIIIGPVFQEVVDMLKHLPLHIVVLAPTPEVAARRDTTRHKVGYTDWTPQQLDHALRTVTPHYGLWIDNSNQTIDETVDAIFANADQTRTGLD